MGPVSLCGPNYTRVGPEDQQKLHFTQNESLTNSCRESKSTRIDGLMSGREISEFGDCDGEKMQTNDEGSHEGAEENG